MNLQQFNAQSLQRACRGDAEAMDFIDKFRQYMHGIDDIEDTQTGTEFRLHTFILAMHVYNHPFFLKHGAALKQLILNITNTYADCVAFEKSDIEWQRQWADHHRHCGLELVLAVAGILGGYVHMRSVSREFRVACHEGHHDNAGRAQ